MPRRVMPPIRQSGVIPYRYRGGSIDILLVTNRGGRRWLIPKGHLETGLSPRHSAMLEAFEEAGVRGILDDRVTTCFVHSKAGLTRVVELYPLAVTRVMPCWPERSERLRMWVAAANVEQLVCLPDLAACIRATCRRLARRRAA